ncbi:uncharacterized protein LOC132643919 [Lycium barbarum]|uniref:uncharacterized protein LOC132643919 n=1 Tax=Lycium barbarum TaxID=112863 RepID=UPI00293EE170|nr:uncharacterized protein LOC132643919 [Lycium barbarum]
MAERDTSSRNTRGSPHAYDGPSFSLGFSQQQLPIAGEFAKIAAERRSKKIHDPPRMRQLPPTEVPKRSKPKDDVPVKKGSKVAQQNKRKVTKPSSDVKGKNVVKDVDLEEDEQDPKFYVRSHPEEAPSMQRYTNIEVFKDIKSKLTVAQLEIFSKTIFGKFLGMQHLEVQAQIFRCFMVRELKESTSDCFTIDINGTVLRFTMREFALMSGLNCVADEGEFTYDEEKSNRIMDDYFGGTRSKVKRLEFIDYFKNKCWGDNDEDAVKFAILFFINTYIFCGESGKTNIPRVHFEVVEDGRYVDYPWGKEAFNELIRSISKKYSATTQYYRIHGMPLAMQVWLYECCSRVPSYLAIKSGNSIPRMLNWRSIDSQPKYNILMEGIFRNGKQSCSKFCPPLFYCRIIAFLLFVFPGFFVQNSYTFANTIPTSSELESLQLPDVVVCRDTVDKNVLVDANEGTQVTDMPVDDFDDFSTTPPHLSKGKQQQRTNQTNSPPSKRRRQLHTTASTSKKQQIHTEPQTTVKKNHKDQKVVGEFTSELSKLRTFMDDNFKKLFEAIKVNNSADKAADSEAPEHQTDAGLQLTPEENLRHDSTIQTSPPKHDDESIKGVGPKLHEEVPEIVVTAGNLRADTRKASSEEINRADEGFFNSTEGMVAEMLIELPLETRVPEAGAGIQPRDITDHSILETPHRFDENITKSQWLIPDEMLPSQIGSSGLSVFHQTGHKGFVMPVMSADKGIQQPVINAEIVIAQPDVIPTRIVKPSKYFSSPYMTNYGSAEASVQDPTPSIFEKKHPFVEDPINGPRNTSFIQQYRNWLEQDLLLRHDKKKGKESRYKKNKQALDPDDINFGFNFGVLHVDDKNWFYLLSMNGQSWNDEHIDVIFYYLRKKGKYDKDNRFKFTTVDCMFFSKIDEIHRAYANVEGNSSVASSENEICEYINGHRMLANVPWHTVDCVLIPVNIKEENHWILIIVPFTDRDCGVYVAAFAEYFCSGRGVPSEIDAETLRNRYGALLWEYGWQKADLNAFSDNELPPRPVRPAIDYNAVDTVVVN